MFKFVLFPFLCMYLIYLLLHSDEPDKFLKPGDHITVDRVFYHHAGIYAGNSMVYHISVDGDLSKKMKKDACAKYDPWKKFTGDDPGRIGVIGR